MNNMDELFIYRLQDYIYIYVESVGSVNGHCELKQVVLNR